MTVARSLIHKNNVLKGGIDSPSKLAKSSMIGMYQVKKVSSGVSRFKFCWSKVNPQTVTIFENKMPSIDRIEFSSQLVPLFVFVFVQQLFWCVRPNLEKTQLKSIIQQNDLRMTPLRRWPSAPFSPRPRWACCLAHTP